MSLLKEKIFNNKFKKRLTIFVGIIAVVAVVAVTVLGNLFVSASGGLRKGGVLFSANEFNYPNGIDAASIKNQNVSAAEINLTWGQLEETECEIDFAKIDKYLNLYKEAGRTVALRISTAYFQPDDTPRWVFSDYGVRRIFEEDYIFTDFETGGDGKIITTGTDDGEVFRLGKGGATLSNLAKNSPTKEEGNYVWGTGEMITSGLRNFGSSGQILGFDFKAVTEGTLEVKVLDNRGIAKVVFTERFNAGDTVSRTVDIPVASISGNREVVFEFTGGSAAIDNINIGVDKAGWYGGGTMCYPDYFDDVYFEKFSNFINKVADYYKNNKTLVAVTVGGYGVYSEPGLGGELSQWKAFGYSTERYIEHIKRCAELYKNAFKDKEVILQTYTEHTPCGEFLYIGNKLVSFAVDNGLSIKTNSQQAMLTEHGGWSGVYWAYTLNRYKHRDDVNVYHETAGQSSNPETHSYMGHPLSLFNRYLIDGTDYYWLYQQDIYGKFASKYLHYANEQAGSAVMTNMFIRFGVYNHIADDGSSTHHYTNIMNGLWLRGEGFYEDVDGTQALSLDVGEIAELSIDDRQKYNTMYGSVVTVRYYDVEEGVFDVSAYVENGEDTNGDMVVLGEVKTTGTETWKTASFYLPAEFNDSKRNSGNDMSVEIAIENISDDALVFFSDVDVDYVPSREWKEEVLVKSDETDNVVDLNGKSVIVNVPDGKRASSLVLPIRTLNETGKSNMTAYVKAVFADGSKVDVTAKEYYMASEVKDPLIIPVSQAPANTVTFEISLETTEGSMAVFAKPDGMPTVEMRGYTVKANGDSKMQGEIISATEPFFGVELDKKYSGKSFVLKKHINGEFVKVAEGVVNSPAYFTPQTAGYYQLEIDGAKIKGTILAMARAVEANAPARSYYGSSVADGFAATDGVTWTPKLNLKNIEALSEGGMTALLNGKNPEIESGALSVNANKEQMFHFVMKNETGSNYVKVYWKTEGDSDYTEKNSALIPVAANDTEYREYSWPIGSEDNYGGKITGLKVLPATGNNEAGRVSIRIIELRSDSADMLDGKVVELKAADISKTADGALFNISKSNTDTDLDIDFKDDEKGGENSKTGVNQMVLNVVIIAAAISAIVLVLVWAGKKKALSDRDNF